MKTFKKVIALVAVIVCCFTICTSTAMAADTVTFSGETTSVRISRDCNVIRYTSGAKTIRPSTGFISLRFTSSTGSVHNYSFMVPKYEQDKNDPTKWGYIQCNLPAGTEMCMPGDNVEMSIELIHPIAMEQGLTFAIREGGRTVGSGRVATIIE